MRHEGQDTYTRAVPSYFPPGPCKLAFVGEAPSYEECERMIPFVGGAGRTLNAMLRASNIDRDACYLGNVYSTKLEDNDVLRHKKTLSNDVWEHFHAGNVARLASELGIVKPCVVVALGATALNALCGTAKIAAHRGQPMPGAGDFAAYTVFPTFHPAALMRQWTMFSTGVADLMKASALADKGGVITYPRRRLNITPTIEEVEAYLAGPCRETALLSCDIETGWAMLRGVSFSPDAENALYVPFIWLSNADKSYWRDSAHEVRAWRAVKACLESDTPKLGQNFGSYDITWLLQKAGIRVRNFAHDTRLLHKALYPELPAKLEFMGSAYSSQGSWKSWGGWGTTQAMRGEKRDN